MHPELLRQFLRDVMATCAQRPFVGFLQGKNINTWQ
jgi:hypothetical protein